MTMPTGPISFSQLQTEFGGANPISLSEYYRGGSYVSASTSSAYGTIPGTGAIALGVFRGTNAAFITAALGNRNASSTPGSADIRSFSDGTLQISGSDSGTTTVNWYTPTTAGIANTYWIKFVRQTGTAMTGSTQGAWLPMTSNYIWTLPNAAFGSVRSATCTIQIATSSAGTTIVSQTATGGWQVVSDNS